jgi:cell division protein FtsQ|tara:strand:+ start:1267 stop:2043 length:777 start_codon:yes stop_codon:yes gene_type:complete
MINVLRKLGGFLVIAGLLVLLSFVRSAQETTLVQNVNIKINDFKGDPFMDKRDIENLVYTRLDTLKGKLIGDLHLSEIENLLESDPSVRNAEVYTTSKGNVHLNVDLKRVIVRLKPDTTNGFYIDEKGEVMDWVAKYTPRVLTVTGNLYNYNRFLKDSLADENLQTHTKLIRDVFALAQFVDKNTYWKAQIGQIYIEENGDAILIPLAGNQEFILGDLSDYEAKLEKIKIFHNEIAKKVGWDKYKVVNLKFSDQIVCK